MSGRSNEQIVGRSSQENVGVACPKCGSHRTAVTVHVADGADHLTLYSCGCCEHRFSRNRNR